MKHSGKAFRAAWRIIFWSFVLLLAVIFGGFIARLVGGLIREFTVGLIAVWAWGAAFTLFFFRDPDPQTLDIPNAIVAPGHGSVDVINEISEGEFMAGPCRRISIFLSVIDVHVQKAPVSARLAYRKHKDGKFLSATRADSADFNENVLLGFVPIHYPDQKLAVRLIAGLLARRIIVWAELGEAIPRGERISLIQFGSRCDVYLPLSTKVHVKLGDHVKGGETLIASFA
jgi:phosphatidylserine decarboxylase